MIKSTTKILITSYNYKRYLDLGYNIPMESKNKQCKIGFERGKVFIEVKVAHLPKSSHVLIERTCDKCGTVDSIVYRDLGSRELCKSCSRKSITGEKNPFYGKKHKKETLDNIKKTWESKKQKIEKVDASLPKIKKLSYGRIVFLEKVKAYMNKHGLDWNLNLDKVFSKKELNVLCPACKKNELNNNFGNLLKKPDSPPKCRSCSLKEVHKNIEYIDKVKASNLKKYGVDNPFKSEIIKEVIKKTNLEKYGVEYSSQSETVKTKIRNTNLERHGTTCPLHSDSIKKKTVKTLLDRYGVDHPSKSEIIKDRGRETTKERYGSEHYLKTEEGKNRVAKTNLDKYGYTSRLADPDFREVIKEGWIEKYGVDNPFKSEIIKEAIKKTNLEKYGHSHFFIGKLLQRNNTSTYEEFCEKLVTFLEENKCAPSSKLCTRVFQANGNVLTAALRSINREDLIGSIASSPENEIFELLSNHYSGPIIRNDRTILKPKELDLYLPELNLAIEYHGLIWHSEKFIGNKNYHYNKYKDCLDQGIQLIQIFSHEWESRKEAISNFLIKKVTPRKRIFARKCNVVTNSERIREFIETNHIQGVKNSAVYLGLEYNGELVMGISLGKHHRNINSELVLNRVCFSDYTIVGGLNKLLKTISEPIITWSDHRVSPLGGMYSNAGFIKECELKPDYFYVDQHENVYSKQSQMKSKTNCPEGMSEWEWAKERGLYKVWDAGKTRWVLRKN